MFKSCKNEEGQNRKHGVNGKNGRVGLHTLKDFGFPQIVNVIKKYSFETFLIFMSTNETDVQTLGCIHDIQECDV